MLGRPAEEKPMNKKLENAIRNVLFPKAKKEGYKGTVEDLLKEYQDLVMEMMGKQDNRKTR